MGGKPSIFRGEEEICPVSDPANSHSISQGFGQNPPNGCFTCSKQKDQFKLGFHYSCITCDVGFHSECYKSRRKIRHPYHSQHPLTLIVRDVETKMGISEHMNSKVLFNTCDWCGEDLKNTFYRCSLCGFCLDLSCVEKSPHPTIKDPKSHHHPLVFFPRPFSLPCDACGLVRISEPVYTCFHCNYMVHRSCTNLPRVIKITRHSHRLSYTPYSPTGNSTCKICYKTIDVKYGHYSCYQDGCSYVAHALCTTDENVWDGNELEWEHEEANEVEDIDEPFQKVGLDLIKYFCHDHHLRIQKYDVVRDAGKQCEACILRIDSRDFYNCTQCNFFLHEVCANLSRRIDHTLHRHPLLLKPSPLDKKQGCSTCNRWFSGFRYECSQSDNAMCRFYVDIQCILVPDCFTHKSHEHSLFIFTSSRSKDDIFCKGCKSRIEGESFLQCTLCTYALCYHCATIPNEIYYKYDKHPLSLCHGEEIDGTYWCEICEKIIDHGNWFYTCTRCCITVHLECIFGSSMYMKFGYTFTIYGLKLKVVCNSNNTRPICSWCKKYCPDFIYYKMQTKSICSLECFLKYKPFV